jgi:ABC-2 type transport system permease protein
MRNMLLIARREYLEQVRGRAFRMTTFGLPAVFALVLGVGYLSSLGLGANRHMAVVAPNLTLANQIRDQLVGDKEAKASIDVLTQATPQQRDTLVRQVEAEQLDGLIWVEATPGKIPSGSYISASSGDFITAARVKSALTHAVLDERLMTGGMQQSDADTLIDGVTLDTLQVKRDGSLVKTNAQAALWKGYVMAFLLSMTTMIYGMNVARSIIQEKTSRIFEVMLAIARPGDLLAGKLIGVGAVGLTQIAIWLVAGAVILVSPLATAIMTGELALRFTWTEAILFPVYFVLGYLFYSSLFAGLAATCETEQELQMYMPLAAAPTWLSFALIMLIINDSNSIWSVLASLFPPTAPVIMFLRMASEIPPAWQLAASIGLLIVSILGVLWFSTRLYRVGILMYGKRATLPELMRWIRYS